MRTIIVIDMQKDFYSPEGSLYVNGAEVLPERFVEVMKDFDNVIFTLDWHPSRHCSFKPQGGIWPPHCVHYTHGASLPEAVVEAAADKNPMFYLKGQNKDEEEYGAFTDIPEDQLAVLRESDEIAIGGLCGDYCVSESIKVLAKLGFADKLTVLRDCTFSIDDGSVLKKTIKEFKLKTK